LVTAFLKIHISSPVKTGITAAKEVRMEILKTKKLGFSLIELLVTIAIIAILAAILTPVISKVRESALQTKDISKLRGMSHAVLLYNSVNGNLPGRLNRAVRIPAYVRESDRYRWFSSFMVDNGYLPNADEFWAPVIDYGIQESGHGYLLNNTVYSDPANFFGRLSSNLDKVSEPLNLLSLRANLAASSIDQQELSEIWMITNLDSENYSSVSTAGSDYAVDGDVTTPWGGRNYVFFDGHVEFIQKGLYPSRD
jgi:prepilin-type N-terminal cleavage/methylation domain-containing protein/prepilin-type processing-associated H-X9-DG protein